MKTFIYRSTTDSELWLQIRDNDGNISVMAEPDEGYEGLVFDDGFTTIDDAYKYMVDTYGDVELIDTI